MAGKNGNSPIGKIHQGTVDFFSSKGGKDGGGFGFVTPTSEEVRQFIFLGRQGVGYGVFFPASACQNKESFPAIPGQGSNSPNSLRSILEGTPVEFRLEKVGKRKPAKQFLAVQVTCLESQLLNSD